MGSARMGPTIGPGYDTAPGPEIRPGAGMTILDAYGVLNQATTEGHAFGFDSP